jgi:hypothetical protein
MRRAHLRTTSIHRPESQLERVNVDTESKNRKIDELATIVEKVEQKAHVAPDNPDLVALRHIVESKISELKMEDELKMEGSNSVPRTRKTSF